MKPFAVTEYKPVADKEDQVNKLDYSPARKEVQVNQLDYTPTAHDVLVRVKAVATNPIDCKRLGNLGNHTELFEGKEPLVVGWDASGIVKDVGLETSLFKVGDEVMFSGNFFRRGAFAECKLADERIVRPKPSSFSWSETALEPRTIVAAKEALYDQLKVISNKEENHGKTILIMGGGGEYIKKLGEDNVLNHRESLTTQIKDLGIENVDNILHTVDLISELSIEFVGLVKPFGGKCSIWPSESIRFSSCLPVPVSRAKNPSVNMISSCPQFPNCSMMGF